MKSKEHTHIVTVCEVTAIWQTETHDTILRLNQGRQGCKTVSVSHPESTYRIEHTWQSMKD